MRVAVFVAPAFEPVCLEAQARKPVPRAENRTDAPGSCIGNGAAPLSSPEHLVPARPRGGTRSPDADAGPAIALSRYRITIYRRSLSARSRGGRLSRFRSV
ncbi:hypothetical protein FTUN_6260 [Frigoriglobus tundricola]|uniref:Uncharacterized protein n=1 Tax=Frigoriglobus tundricola TaxID=2774151 RepID=A0A6M5YXG5_9BACT|nr:hypothetical protein FTUN_6260 [Frigoriglobus tundricola]